MRSLMVTTARRFIIGVVGFTVTLVGLVMVLVPGPAIVVVPIGLAILATELAWAKRLLKRLKTEGQAMLGTSPKKALESDGTDLATAEGVLQHQIDLEALKLLVQVAWADHIIAPEEAEHILSMARQMEAKDHELRFLEQALADEGRLPAPNLDMLRGRYTDVMQSIDRLIAIDHQIVDDERAVRDAVAHILTEPETGAELER